MYDVFVLHAGFEIVCMGIIVPRKSECCAIKGTHHDQIYCILECFHFVPLDDCSCSGTLFTHKILHVLHTLNYNDDNNDNDNILIYTLSSHDDILEYFCHSQFTVPSVNTL